MHHLVMITITTEEELLESRACDDWTSARMLSGRIPDVRPDTLRRALRR